MRLKSRILLLLGLLLTFVHVRAQQPQQVRLAFTGDVMMGTNFPSNYITPDRGKSLFTDCDSLMRHADATIINLEGTCYDGDEGELRKMTNPNTYFIFRTPGDHAERLAEAGVDAVGMANNHSFDFGLTGRRLTVENIRSVGVEVAGLRGMAEGCVLIRKGVRIGYLAFAASCTRVLDMLNVAEVDSMLHVYREMSDLLVVSFHGGAEGVAHQHVPKAAETYVGERRGNVYDFAHHCIDMGADIVVGHGPHVPRALELYQGHLIAYSLGNFCTPYRMGVRGVTGYAPLLEVTLNVADGTFDTGRIHSFIQQSGKGPRLDAQHRVALLMRQLSLDDFPDSPLDIDKEGYLCPKPD